MNAIVAERYIRSALVHKICLAADQSYKKGEEVLVYCENSREWIGSIRVVSTQGRMVTVQSLDGEYNCSIAFK